MFFKRLKDFKVLFVIALGLYPLFILLNSLVVYFAQPDFPFLCGTMAKLLFSITLIQAVIGIVYILKSKRVKETFIN